MPWPQDARHISQDACRRNSTQRRARRWKAWFADEYRLIRTYSQVRASEKGGQFDRPFSTEVCNTSKHLHAHHVNAVASNVAAHGYVMTFVTFQSVRILYREYLLVAIGHYYHLSPGSQALLCAGFGPGISTLGTALVVADPAFHGGLFVIPR